MYLSPNSKKVIKGIQLPSSQEAIDNGIIPKKTFWEESCKRKKKRDDSAVIMTTEYKTENDVMNADHYNYMKSIGAI